MNLCICCYCGKLTYDHCRECAVALCWTCSFSGEHGHSGLCGVCMRLEQLKERWKLPTLASIPPALILTEEFVPWAASQAKIYSNEDTELVEVGK